MRRAQEHVLDGIRRIEVLVDSNWQPNVPKPVYGILFGMVYARCVCVCVCVCVLEHEPPLPAARASAASPHF